MDGVCPARAFHYLVRASSVGERRRHTDIDDQLARIGCRWEIKARWGRLTVTADDVLDALATAASGPSALFC